MKRAMISWLKPVVDSFPKFAGAYRYVRDSRGLHEPPLWSPLGFHFLGSPTMARGEFEPVETRLVQRLLRDADVLVNVGANIGYYCCIALAAGKSVVAVEPMPLNVRYLMRNIHQNQWSGRAEIFPLALSDRPGIVEMYGGGTGASLLKGWANTPESASTLVPASTLDRVLAPAGRGGQSLLFVVDIEGAERQMLAGAAACLALEPRPMWMMEIAISDHQPAGIAINPNLQSTFEVFFALGYGACTADDSFTEVTPELLARIATTGINSLRTHNFLFSAPAALERLRGERS